MNIVRNTIQKMFQNPFLGCLSVVLGLTGLLTLFSTFQSIFFPYQIDYVEGMMLNHAGYFLEGTPPYLPISQFPYIACPYTPLFLMIYAGFISMFGPSLVLGRLLVFGSYGVCLVMVYLILRHLTKEKHGAFPVIMGTVLFGITQYVLLWSFLLRTDMMALMWTSMGLYWVMRFKYRRLVFIAVLFFLAAYFTKQTYLMAPISVMIMMFISHRKKGLLFAALFGFGLLIISGILNTVTDGQYLLHTIAYNLNDFRVVFLINGLLTFVLKHSVMTAFSIVGVIWTLKKRQGRLISLYVLLTFFAGITCGKVGSDTNYFLEVIMGMGILTGLGLKDITVSLKTPVVYHLVLSLLIIQSVVFLFEQSKYRYYVQPIMDVNSQKQLVKHMDKIDGPILSENMGLLAITHRKVPYQPFIMTQLYQQGVWQQDGFLAQLKNQYYKAIILSFHSPMENYRYSLRTKSRFTQEMIHLIDEKYASVEKFGEYHLYRPKNN
ncbi:MAG: hypothetical protein HRT90_08405 [Candidatus Margulisbacteria bacterium]|nr:hypothetical protein [Candidatus Margulisiibacteriota bacterium]